MVAAEIHGAVFRASISSQRRFCTSGCRSSAFRSASSLKTSISWSMTAVDQEYPIASVASFFFAPAAAFSVRAHLYLVKLEVDTSVSPNPNPSSSSLQGDWAFHAGQEASSFDVILATQQSCEQCEPVCPDLRASRNRTPPTHLRIPHLVVKIALRISVGPL